MDAALACSDSDPWMFQHVLVIYSSGQRNCWSGMFEPAASVNEGLQDDCKMRWLSLHRGF